MFLPPFPKPTPNSDIELQPAPRTQGFHVMWSPSFRTGCGWDIQPPPTHCTVAGKTWVTESQTPTQNGTLCHRYMAAISSWDKVTLSPLCHTLTAIPLFLLPHSWEFCKSGVHCLCFHTFHSLFYPLHSGLIKNLTWMVLTRFPTTSFLVDGQFVDPLSSPFSRNSSLGLCDPRTSLLPLSLLSHHFLCWLLFPYSCLKSVFSKCEHRPSTLAHLKDLVSGLILPFPISSLTHSRGVVILFPEAQLWAYYILLQSFQWIWKPTNAC